MVDTRFPTSVLERIILTVGELYFTTSNDTRRSRIRGKKTKGGHGDFAKDDYDIPCCSDVKQYFGAKFIIHNYTREVIAARSKVASGASSDGHAQSTGCFDNR